MHVDAHELTSRRESEQHGGDERHREREQQDGGIDADVAGDGQARRAQLDERTNEPHREKDTARTARTGQQHALREQLCQDAASSRTQRKPERNFLPSGGRARDEQARHVRRRDQEQQTDGREEEPDRRSDIGHELRAQ